MSVSFECTTSTRIPQEQLFDLARNIDAHRQSMAASREKAVAGVRTGLIERGQDVTWRAWHFGVPLRMTSRVTEMDAPRFFVDEQVAGPFQRFHHVHAFSTDAGTGLTTMTDRIEFTAPFGPLGRLVEKLVLGRYLRRLIERRNDYLVGADGA